jgi:hypothetical protein
MLRSGARFERSPVGTCLGPATILYRWRENNRCVLPLGPFDCGICRTAAADRDSRVISFGPVEANGKTVIHREPDSCAIVGKLTIGDARERLRKIDVTSREI